MTEICRGFTDDQWKSLKNHLIEDGVITDDTAAWDCAIQVFKRRIEERFLSSIEALQRSDSKHEAKETPNAPPDCSTLPPDSENVVVPGFAIMALCCLLVETLAGFRKTDKQKSRAVGPCPFPDGDCIKPKPEGSSLIVEFLQRESFGQDFTPGIAKKFVRGIRDGIFHEGETRKWPISRNRPEDRIVESLAKNRYRLNRTKFYKALEAEFETYIEDLQDSANPEIVKLRQRFVEKMQDIVNKC